jgi:hypothetical protein
MQCIVVDWAIIMDSKHIGLFIIRLEIRSSYLEVSNDQITFTTILITSI